ncbi:hypothetical protein V8D89_006727 [Ganoderma adspersum]
MSDPDVPETRPLKRTRLSTDDSTCSQIHPSGPSSTSSSTLQRHPEIWFDDGNIVLVARETAFRIYRGLLAGQSTVFSDMFASSTSSPDETFDGYPVVHLSDSPHDLAHLLRVLLPKSRIHYRTTRASPVPTFDEISAVIRLAHKYNIPQVQEEALTSLPSMSQIPLMPAHYIGVVNLARLTDTPTLLPLALYNCAYLDSSVLDGWTREDGTVEHLSCADARRCIDARIVLTDERTLSLSRLFDATPSRECVSRIACIAELHRVPDIVLRSELTRRVRPLYDWTDTITRLGGGFPCGPCREELLERNERERKRVFDSLPEIFGITVEGWGMAEAEAEPATGDEPEN